MSRLPPPGQDKMQPLHLVDQWPQEWLRHYDKSRYVRHDPVMARLLSSLEPFAWADTPVDRREQPTAFRIMNEAAEFGLVDGYSIPIFDPSGFEGCISLAGARLDPDPEIRRALHLVSLWAYGTAERLFQAERPRAELSEREREVLRWVAIGRSQAEVADILGIAEKTVEAHLRNARLKLRTRNTTHTTVVALQTRQIRL
ncbi:MAG: autoinducer binding domain-containing protein [Methylobacteriaceae bacterium]|nr:autoinducer binding domain-containing protein [Methylobacteriaceae bacterium]